MRVGLFIPCYVDQFYPQVGIATVEVLERLGLEVDFPQAQTCCGQPMANTGCTDQTKPLAEHFCRTFASYDHVVCPSGSCVAMVRQHYESYFPPNSPLHDDFRKIQQSTAELCEFLTDVLDVSSWEGSFPHRVGLHQSCHGLRELRLGACSEIVGDPFSKPAQLLGLINGLQLTTLSRPDECCGFGGTFSVNEEAVSCEMGRDRIRDHQQAGTEVLTSADMSCLMHLDGLIRREKLPLHVMHIAEILAGHRPLENAHGASN